MAAVLFLTVALLVGLSAADNEQVSRMSIEYFLVKTFINHRVDTTIIYCEIRNLYNSSQRLGLDVTLQRETLVNDLQVYLGGTIYHGKVVKTRSEDAASNQIPFDIRHSAVSVNLDPWNNDAVVYSFSVQNVSRDEVVTFKLKTYSIVARQREFYIREVYVRLRCAVFRFSIKASITENTEILDVYTPSLEFQHSEYENEFVEDLNPVANVSRTGERHARVVWNAFGRGPRGYIATGYHRIGLQYILKKEYLGKELMVQGSHFVQYIIPPSDGDLRDPKDILFVLDLSGSMSPSKLQHLQDAMVKILTDLKPSDRFSIVTYSDTVRVWRRYFSGTNVEHIRAGISFVKTMKARGLANTNGALIAALSVLNNRKEKTRSGVIFFVTGGPPSCGEQNIPRILRNIARKNNRSVSIFTVALGQLVEKRFLKPLSEQNYGFVRTFEETQYTVYDIKDVFDEISDMYVKDITIGYLVSGQYGERKVFKNYSVTALKGSETIICGQLKRNTDVFEYFIRWSGYYNGSRKVQERLISLNVRDYIVTKPAHIVKSIRVYQLIQRLLKKRQTYFWNRSIRAVTKRIVDLSLTHSFVTSFTSMVVDAPDRYHLKISQTELRLDRPADVRCNSSALDINNISHPLEIGLSSPAVQSNTTTKHRPHTTLQSEVKTVSITSKAAVVTKANLSSTTYKPTFWMPQTVTVSEISKTASQAINVTVQPTTTSPKPHAINVTAQEATITSPKSQAIDLTAQPATSPKRQAIDLTVQPTTKASPKLRGKEVTSHLTATSNEPNAPVKAISKQPKRLTIRLRAVVLKVSPSSNLHGQMIDTCVGLRLWAQGQYMLLFSKTWGISLKTCKACQAEGPAKMLILKHSLEVMTVYLKGEKVWSYDSNTGWNRIIDKSQAFFATKMAGIDIKITRRFYEKSNSVHFRLYVTLGAVAEKSANEFNGLLASIATLPQGQPQQKRKSKVSGCNSETTPQKVSVNNENVQDYLR